MGLSIGQRLQAAIQLKQMSPAQLAREAGTTDATISNWMNDMVKKDHVKAVQLFRIADAAGISARELLLGDEAFGIAEPRAAYASHPVQRDVLKVALQLVSEVLEERGRKLPPEKQAEATQLAYDLIEEGLPQAKVLRFVLAAVA